MKILITSNKKILKYFVIFLVGALLIFIGYQNLKEINKKTGEIKISEENPSWNTYTNYEYGFEIDFPADWKIYEDFENVSPIINIYIPNNNLKPPFDNFADVNNVSIFPRGLQSEIIIGQFEESEIDVDFEYDEMINYLLEDNTVWATYIKPEDLGDPWESWGFIWTKTRINNIEYKCLENEVEVSLDECNPFEGDEFVRTGQVDSEIREIQEEIVKSFKVIEK
ncbi:hypothetical protein GW764_02455 [Candidatus Parcubacteria bacterium]|nr:hypothetical protein [Candidatus Parcubacteria bacterium]